MVYPLVVQERHLWLNLVEMWDVVESALSQCPHLPKWPFRQDCRGLLATALDSEEADGGKKTHLALS